MAEQRKNEGKPLTRDDLYGAIMEGAVERVRPKMMTVAAIMAGLLPILWSTRTGSEVMQRIAVPMVGGMISSTVLTLLVIPAIYALVKARAVEGKTARRLLGAEYTDAGKLALCKIVVPIGEERPQHCDMLGKRLNRSTLMRWAVFASVLAGVQFRRICLSS